MRRAAVLLIVLAAAPSAHGEKKKTTAKLLSGVSASVSGGIVLAGFLTADNGQRFNTPVLYTGLATSVITPSFGQWYVGEYVTIGIGVRAFAALLATWTLQTQHHTASCDNAPSADAPKCEIWKE